MVLRKIALLGEESLELEQTVDNEIGWEFENLEITDAFMKRFVEATVVATLGFAPTDIAGPWTDYTDVRTGGVMNFLQDQKL